MLTTPPTLARLNDDLGAAPGAASQEGAARTPRGLEPAPPAGVAAIRELTRAECDALLARHTVGRVAYAWRDRVDIAPLHYVYDAPWVYARTSPGHKLAVLAHNRWVAFEVDEVAGTFEWRSVVVRGAVELLDEHGTPRDRAAWARAVQLLRRIVPALATDDDPAPFRTALFRIRVDDLSGRAATPPGAGARVA